jgi:integrase/recombinase XerD
MFNLKREDSDRKRMIIGVKFDKGNKDRLTILSPAVLADLSGYYKKWKPYTIYLKALKEVGVA